MRYVNNNSLSLTVVQMTKNMGNPLGLLLGFSSRLCVTIITVFLLLFIYLQWWNLLFGQRTLYVVH